MFPAFQNNDKLMNQRIAITFMPYFRPWNNVELIKDSGLIPYLFAKKYGLIVYMIGKAPDGVAPGLYSKSNADVLRDAYPYYDYVKDMNLLLLAEEYLLYRPV